MKKITKNNQSIDRVVLELGDDQFCLDSDGEVFKNGFGQVYTKTNLYYMEKDNKRMIPYFDLFEMLFIKELEPKEAIRRIRLKATMPKSIHARRNRAKNAFRAKRTGVLRSDGARADSMTKAAKKLGCTTAAISKSVKTGGKVKGYTFQLLTKTI